MDRETLRQKVLDNDANIQNSIIWRHMSQEQKHILLAFDQLWRDSADVAGKAALDSAAARYNSLSSCGGSLTRSTMPNVGDRVLIIATDPNDSTRKGPFSAFVTAIPQEGLVNVTVFGYREILYFDNVPFTSDQTDLHNYPNITYLP